MNLNLPNPVPETEVDFVHLAKTIWQRKMLIMKLTGIAAITGFLVSIMIPNQFTASTTLVQDRVDPLMKMTEARLSAISALASVAGVDLNGLSRAKMSPKSYSTILSSIPFRQELMKTRLPLGQMDSSITLYDYNLKGVKRYPLLSKIKELPNQIVRDLPGVSGNPNNRNAVINQADYFPRQTEEELAVNRIIDKQISLQLLDDEFITLSCTLPEAIAAAKLTKSASELLQRFLIEIQTEKARMNFKFIHERQDEARMNFLKSQKELSAIHSANEFATLSSSCRSAESMYLELSRKLEESRIVLNEQLPVFRTINPVTVPDRHSYPNRAKISLIFAFFGFMLGIVKVFGKGFFEETIEKWRR